MYWSTNNLYHTPVFQKAMRNFFIVTTTTILNMMPTMKIETDCIKYDHLLTCCMLDAKQFIHLVKTNIDESLVLFKGRLKFKQFIKTK